MSRRSLQKNVQGKLFIDDKNNVFKVRILEQCNKSKEIRETEGYIKERIFL